MGKLKERLTDYKNFWLIWLNCAGKPEKGESLFQIQSRWGITTNYLYHNEMGLGKPIYICMVEEGYLQKSGKKLIPLFGWVESYVKELYTSRLKGSWIPWVFIANRWELIQKFIEQNASVLFDINNLKILYKNDKDLLGIQGRYIFSDILLYVLFANLIVFTKKYHADIVMRILSTFISLFSERDLLNYMREIHQKIGGFVPKTITDESELHRLMYPYKW